MGTFDSGSWLAVVLAATAGSKLEESKAAKTKDAQVHKVNGMINADLEYKVQERVYLATIEEEQKIWDELEAFKRDNPHKIVKHLGTSFWGHVGKERFPVTYVSMAERLGKAKLTKADEKMLSTYRCWVVTLLMNTLGWYSTAEATRIVYGGSVEFG